MNNNNLTFLKVMKSQWLIKTNGGRGTTTMVGGEGRSLFRMWEMEIILCMISSGRISADLLEALTQYVDIVVNNYEGCILDVRSEGAVAIEREIAAEINTAIHFSASWSLGALRDGGNV